MTLQEVIQDIIRRTDDKTALWEAEYDSLGSPTHYRLIVGEVWIDGYPLSTQLKTTTPVARNVLGLSVKQNYWSKPILSHSVLKLHQVKT